MKRKKQVKSIFEEDESAVLNIEDLTEIQGGIEDESKDVPVGSCGLGCFQGTGGVDDPTDERK